MYGGRMFSIAYEPVDDPDERPEEQWSVSIPPGTVFELPRDLALLEHAAREGWVGPPDISRIRPALDAGVPVTLTYRGPSARPPR
jgi:hypothetical protein